MTFGDTRTQQAFGLLTVQRIAQIDLHCGWQEVAAINDNGVDAIIIDRRKGVDTGSLYFVQVKCGDSYIQNAKKRPDHLGIAVGQDYIAAHRPRWEALIGPAILVYVDAQTGRSFWTDLRSEASYCPQENKSIILVPKCQRFGSHSLGDLRSLRSFRERDRTLSTIRVFPNEIPTQNFSETPKAAARSFYREWANASASARTHSSLGEIGISRVGWRHVSAKGRGLHNVLQSWMLLGVAKRIIQSSIAPYTIRAPDKSETLTHYVFHDYISLRSRVAFPNRHEAVVQVVLKRIRSIEKATGSIQQRIWFYSVHEPRRGKGGAQ